MIIFKVIRSVIRSAEHKNNLFLFFISDGKNLTEFFSYKFWEPVNKSDKPCVKPHSLELGLF
jgi:hypothetical protein